MKVTLLKDIKKLGRKGEVREVADGHAMNFLVPQRLANIYTAASAKELTKKTSKPKSKKAKK